MKSVSQSINNHVNGWMGVLTDYLGLSDTTAMLCLIAVVFIVGMILFYVVRPIMLAVVDRVANRDKSVWLKAAYQNHVFHRIAWLIPGFVVMVAIPIILDSSLPLAPVFASVMDVFVDIYMVGVIAAVLSSVLNTMQTRFMTYRMAYRYSIKSYIQVLKIILFSLTAIVMVSISIGRSPMYLLTGLGAMTAVGMLVFKDSILGFVASIQLSAYDIIRVGDWIEMSKYGANGNVIDISLNTIKIQNFDKTIVTIPSFAILSEGILNWRGMKDSGGRRIKRNMTININSIKMCSPELIARLSELPLLKTRLDDYLKTQKRHIDDAAVKMLGADPRCLTNLTLYRLYLESYLRSHPCVNPNFSFLVRELQDTNYGVPLEIYIFLNITEWSMYESIQCDIFDYLYTVLPLFELQAYQYSSETKKGYQTGAV